MSVLLLVVGAWALLCLLAWVFQDRLLYFPTRGLASDPSDHGLAFEDVALTAADGVRLHGWYLPPPGDEPPRGVVVFLHGNAGNVEGRIPSAAAFLEMGLACLLFDYRGYGRSEGEPGEEGTYLDALAAWDHLTGERGFAPGRIVAYGESLGGAVAIELACRRPLGALVVESAFRSLAEVGARHYPWLPVRLLARGRYDSESKVPGLEVPFLVIHSPADEIVPFSHGRALFEAAREPRAFLETEAGHNDGGFQRRAEWRARVGEFLVTALAGRTSASD